MAGVMRRSLLGAAAMLTAAGSGLSGAEPSAARLSIDPDGTAHVPAFDLPPSAFMSGEAVARLKARAGVQAPAKGDELVLATGHERIHGIGHRDGPSIPRSASISWRMAATTVAAAGSISSPAVSRTRRMAARISVSSTSTNSSSDLARWSMA